MARRLSYAEKQRVARRTADITRLQSEYQRAAEGYTAAIGQKEAAFKTEMDKYTALYEPYQKRATAYQQRLTDYQAKLKAYQDAPLRTVATNIEKGSGWGAGYYFNRNYVDYGGKNYGPGPAPGEAAINIGQMNRFQLREGYEWQPTSGNVGMIVTKGVKNPGAFTEKFEEQAPTAPAAIDISAEKAALAREKDYTEREVAERNKARLRAVQRGQQRPMLSAGTSITQQG